MRKFLADRKTIIGLMVIQFAPLLMFPASTFKPTSLEWWLPVLLAVMSLIAFAQIVLTHTTSLGPWYLLSFAQGFNIISRLMMLMPHSTEIVDKQQVFATGYVSLTVAAMLISAFLLWYFELPEVRNSWLNK